MPRDSNEQRRRTSIDLNADVGEGMAADAALLALVSSCSIACGGHAGDRDSMTTAIAGARRHGVAIGAHPSYPDREGFGRRSRFLTGDALLDSLHTQIGEFAEACTAGGDVMRHIKPHGALYNDAAEDDALAAIVVRACAAAPDAPALWGPPGSALQRAARAAGLEFRAEAFADRGYGAGGRLLPRGEAGALLEPAAAARQAVSIARCEPVAGTVIAADTLCVHGDSPAAGAIAQAVCDALREAGVQIRAT